MFLFGGRGFLWKQWPGNESRIVLVLESNPKKGISFGGRGFWFLWKL